MAFSLFFFIETLFIKKLDSVSIVGSALFPQILLVMIFVISAINLLNTWRKGKKENSVKSEKRPNHWAALLTVVMLVLTVVLSDYIGFTVMSGLFLFVFALYMNRKFNVRNIVKLAVFAVIVSVAIRYAFVDLLQLTLPSGILF